MVNGASKAAPAGAPQRIWPGATAARVSFAPVDSGRRTGLSLAGDLLLDQDGGAAVEPASWCPQRRVAADASLQLARRRGRARLLQLACSEDGRPAAEGAASRRARHDAQGGIEAPRAGQ